MIKGKIVGRILFYLIMLGMPFYFTDTNFFPPYSALFLAGICWSFYYEKKIKTIEFIIVFKNVRLFIIKIRNFMKDCCQLEIRNKHILKILWIFYYVYPIK